MTQLIWTFNTLTSALQNWLDDTDADWANAVTLSQIISLGEQKLVDDLDLTVFDITSTVTLNSGVILNASQVARPANILITDDVYYQAPGSIKLFPIERRDISWILDYLDPLVSGPPQYYAEQDTVNYVFAPFADQAYTITTTGPFAAQSLNDVAPAATTWLSSNLAQIMLEACLMEASKFLKNEGKRKIQEMVYNSKLGPVKLRFRALRRNLIEDPRAVGGQAAEGQLPASAPAQAQMGNVLTRT
jgi:hypothetical protein